jgi:hypothetical protein
MLCKLKGFKQGLKVQVFKFPSIEKKWEEKEQALS